MNYLIFLTLIFALNETNPVTAGWWDNSTTIYDVYIWSFKDSNNDGIGDIKGITSKIDYLKDLGITAIKLSQIFSSPDEISDSYAIDNFYAIHRTLGNLADFDELINEATNRGIKIILDINVNHCHESHEWFRNSVRREDPYTDFFIWKNGKTNSYTGLKQPPNNQKNTLGKSAWKWNVQRKQFYYNYYNSFSPHFNRANENLLEEIKKVFEFWLNRGVSGFNLVDIETYLADNFHQGAYFIRSIRNSINSYNERDSKNQRLLMTKINGDGTESIKKFVKSFGNSYFDFVTIPKLAEFNPRTNTPAKFFIESIGPIVDNVCDYLLEWQIESHDKNRISTRSNKETIQVLLIIQTVLPGVMRIYYGSELGMSEYFGYSRKCVHMEWEYSDSKTLPMQWDNSLNAGFSGSKCLIQKPNPNYQFINVEKETNDPSSTLNLVKTLQKLRQTDGLKYGSTKFFYLNDYLFILRRSTSNETIFTVVNLNNMTEYFNFDNLPWHSESSKYLVLAASSNSLYKRNDKVEIYLELRPMSSVILMSKNNK